MDWDKVGELAREKLATFLTYHGWKRDDGKGEPLGRGWSLYKKGGSKIRCYSEAKRSDTFTRFVTGYWIKIEAPAVGSIKRRLAVRVVVSEWGDVVAIGIDEERLLRKIADVS